MNGSTPTIGRLMDAFGQGGDPLSLMRDLGIEAIYRIETTIDSTVTWAGASTGVTLIADADGILIKPHPDHEGHGGAVACLTSQVMTLPEYCRVFSGTTGELVRDGREMSDQELLYLRVRQVTGG